MDLQHVQPLSLQACSELQQQHVPLSTQPMHPSPQKYASLQQQHAVLQQSWLESAATDALACCEMDCPVLLTHMMPQRPTSHGTSLSGGSATRQSRQQHWEIFLQQTVGLSHAHFACWTQQHCAEYVLQPMQSGNWGRGGERSSGEKKGDEVTYIYHNGSTQVCRCRQ